MSIFLVVIVAFVFPIRFAIYSLIITLLIVFIINFRKRRIPKTIFIKLYSTFVFVYILMQICLSISPYIKVQEFNWSHKNWNKTKMEIQEIEAHNFQGFKSSGFAYVTANYQFSHQGNIIHTMEKSAVRRYFPLWSKLDSYQKKEEVIKRATRFIASKQPVLFVHKSDPNQTRLFLSQEYIYLKGSILYQFLGGMMLICILIITSFACLTFYLIRRKITQKADSNQLYQKLIMKTESISSNRE